MGVVITVDVMPPATSTVSERHASCVRGQARSRGGVGLPAHRRLGVSVGDAASAQPEFSRRVYVDVGGLQVIA